MDIKSIKNLVEKFSSAELLELADQFEQGHAVSVKTQEDPGDQLSDFLQAAEVKQLMEQQNIDVNLAVREFSKRVRGILN